MNVYDDVMRRIYHMVNELHRIGHDDSQYLLVMSHRLYVDFIADAPRDFVADHRKDRGGAYLFGYRLAFDERRAGPFLAMRHEVQG